MTLLIAPVCAIVLLLLRFASIGELLWVVPVIATSMLTISSLKSLREKGGLHSTQNGGKASSRR